MDHLEGALKWWDQGCSVVPVVPDGSKRPFGYWTEYQQTRATREQVESWFKTSPAFGVGVICGAVSGNLEMLELEGRANTSEALSKISATIGAEGLAEEWNDLLYGGYVESTPSGGIHILYRITGGTVPGNQKIARRPATADELADNPKDRVKVLSETRGEGGFVVVAPSSGTVHKTGDAWTVIVGEIGSNIPVIERVVRDRIMECIYTALDEMPVVERTAPSAPSTPRDGTSPGDDFNNRTNWGQLLESYGWSYASARGTEQFWTRPGKDMRDARDHSATLYYQGSDNLYVFSSSTELPCEEPISKFAFYTYMEHRGDFSAAARQLSRDGYGQRDTVEDWLAEVPHVPARMGGVVESPTPAVAGAVEDTPAPLRIEQFSEKGIGRFAGQALRKRVRFVSQEKAWRVYRKGTWSRDHEQEVPRLIGLVSDKVDEKVDEIYSKAKAAFDAGEADGKERLDDAKKLKTFARGIATNRGMKAVAEIAAATPDVGVSADAFDRDLTKIALNNGTFDLKTMSLIDHDPKHMLTKRINVNFDPSAVAHRHIRYMEEVLPDAAYRDYLQRAAGMALMGDTSESAFFVLWGETGCGKSQFLEIMNAVFGDYGVTAAPATFRESANGDDSRKSNSLHALRGARFVATSETSERSSLSGELVKRVTGGDSVKSHALYESEIEWKPVFTMFMGTNFRPVLDASDGAIWRRVKPIEFPNTFYVDNQPTAEREKGLAQKIIDTELAGVLNWVIEGARQYLAIGLKDPDAMGEDITAYREDSNPVLGFVNDSLAEGTLLADAEARISSRDLYRMFANYQRESGVRIFLGQNKFGKHMSKLGYASVKGTGGVRMWAGLKVNPTTWIGDALR